MTHYKGDKDTWETPCPDRKDSIHCVCWYDGLACCACGDIGLVPSPQVFVVE
mgnify:FL=1